MKKKLEMVSGFQHPISPLPLWWGLPTWVAVSTPMLPTGPPAHPTHTLCPSLHTQLLHSSSWMVCTAVPSAWTPLSTGGFPPLWLISIQIHGLCEQGPPDPSCLHVATALTSKHNESKGWPALLNALSQHFTLCPCGHTKY